MTEQFISGKLLLPPIIGGDKNSLLHLVIWFQKREVRAINDVLINDNRIRDADLDSNGVVTSAPYANRVRLRKHLGEPNQAADKLMISEIPEWTTNHRLRGIAYLYVRLVWDSKIFPDGIPLISAWVEDKHPTG